MAVLLTEEQVLGVRERIRAAAERHVAAHGPDAISLRSIAAELGWTAASLYRYYASKAELLDALRIAAHDRFSDRIEAAHASTDDLWDRSRAIGDAYVQFAQDEPAAYRLMFANGLDEGEKSPELHRAEQRSNRTLTGYVRDMVEAGLLTGDADLIAHAYWAAIHGLVMLRMAGKLDNSPPFETLRHAAMRMITRGARA
ncbi:TetR/AcrR family transcriptional regulator [Novosphingobium sp.]|uniref:TetR/AcrR family transcriptional regulator n=1 Tax=Novosphingobium sp. TaxID=1874826 RepID=UPI0035B34EED